MAVEDQHTARDRVVADIDALCKGTDMDRVRELSDPAALLVASGQVGPEIRGIVVWRIRQGLGFPGIGGYYQLRMLAVQQQSAQEVAGSGGSQMLRLSARTMAAEAQRRLQAHRAAFVRGGGYFPTRGRDIRAARRDHEYLDPQQRQHLFDALTLTPTVRAIKGMPKSMIGVGTRIMESGARQVYQTRYPEQRQRGGVPRPLGAETAGRGGEPVPSQVQTAALPEMYTAALLEAGILYDRLILAYRFGGAETDELRLQFNAENELAQIAADIVQLRRAGRSRTEAAHAGSQGFSDSTGLGEMFDVAWAEVVERICAFRELVEMAESRATSVVNAQRAEQEASRVPGFPAARPDSGLDSASRQHLDHVADSLAATGGDRQVSIETMRRLRNNLRRPGEDF